MKKLVAVVLVAALGWVAWPFWSAYSLFAAVRDADEIAIEQGVDWPSLRAGLSSDFKAAMMEKMADEALYSDKSADALAMGMAAMLGPAIVDRAVDAIVTPKGIVRLVSGATSSGDKPSASNGTGPQKSDGLRTDRVRYAFLTGPTDFRLDVATDPIDGREGIVTFLFAFQGGGWKLARILLPMDQMMAQARQGNGT